MISLKPRSIQQLTITGFLTVAGILIIALIITAGQVGGLSAQSQRMLSQSSQATEALRVIIEQASAMERNARQYQIVGDNEIFRVYLERRQSLMRETEALNLLELNADIASSVAELLGNEDFNFQLLSAVTAGNSAAPAYRPLLDVAYQISNQLGDWSALQLRDIQNETGSTQRLLWIQAVLLSAVALIIAAFFTALITRPLVQIEKAINQLGSGAYETNIAIDGPADLVRLGSSLDWLRGRLEKLEQQRSSFLRHVSHELKTPLAAIQESAALIKEGVAGEVNAEQHKLLNILGNNSLRLQALIDDLLRYHSEILSVLNAMPHPVRIDKVIASVLETHDFVIKTGKLKVITELEKIHVSGDAEQLRVIVDNLLTNAIKFSPEEGVISISLALNDKSVILDVIDQGPGISGEDQEKIFEAFYQGNASARNFFKGSGLGLAIVKEYINANRGSIDVMPCTSGAHFRILFPV